MSETKPKFTPGPWAAERKRLNGHEWFIRSKSRNKPPFDWSPRLNVMLPPLDADSRLKRVDCNRGSGSSDDGCCDIAISENAANAHLIASAPDLYAALEAFVSDCSNDECERCTAASAALSKARGEKE